MSSCVFMTIYQKKNTYIFCGLTKVARFRPAVSLYGSGPRSRLFIAIPISLWVVVDLVEFAFRWSLRRFSDRVVVCSLLMLLGSGLASPRFSHAGWGFLASSEGNAFVLLTSS